VILAAAMLAMSAGIGRADKEPTIRFADGSKYWGGVKDGRMHGHGKLVYTNGMVYVGDFVENRRHGQGKLVGPFGEDSTYTYIGEFKKG